MDLHINKHSNADMNATIALIKNDPRNKVVGRKCKQEFPNYILDSLREELGLKGIWYCYDIAHPDNWSPLSKSRSTAIRRFVRRRRLYASSSSSIALWYQQMEHYPKLKHVMEGIWQNEIYFWPMNELTMLMNRALEHAGVASLVSITVRCPLTTEFRGRFTLLMAEQQGEVNLLKLEVLKEKLVQVQRDISIELSKEINPLLDYNIVSPMSVYILKLMVLGHTRSEISSQLRLSAGGINYHLNSLKQSLGSFTTTQLVYRATQLQLI